MADLLHNAPPPPPHTKCNAPEAFNVQCRTTAMKFRIISCKCMVLLISLLLETSLFFSEVVKIHISMQFRAIGCKMHGIIDIFSSVNKHIFH